ncbi:hypothetical protein HK100_010338 [Physocladia obscura]|uniref:Uncharacterized protein n=1 Tax=Physocladia obscura TaxID=109957 RepID=A0AAD5T2L2_9FUNG|nr:hypothetical protein HK100_010338 [Physocladia obscura]
MFKTTEETYNTANRKGSDATSFLSFDQFKKRSGSQSIKSPVQISESATVINSIAIDTRTLPQSPRRQRVSFGGSSIKSFNSSDSPTSINSDCLQISSVTDNALVIQDPDLIPLPDHHTTSSSPLNHLIRRIEHLVINPSNDFITALLAYKTAQSNDRTPSGLSSAGSNKSAPFNLPQNILALPELIQADWESALRVRIPKSDWSKLIEEILQNSLAVNFGNQRRTYHEAKLYWDIIWRTLPIGCALGNANCARCGNVEETFVHFLWTCPVAISLWRRLEWVVGAIADSEAKKERAVSLHRYGGGSRRNYDWNYGLAPDGRVNISLVDVLFCFPRVRRDNMNLQDTGEGSGPSERFVKTVMVLHATALMSLLEMRAYPGENISIIWTLFITRYEARRSLEVEQRYS